jgi:hypothetical protein
MRVNGRLDRIDRQLGPPPSTAEADFEALRVCINEHIDRREGREPVEKLADLPPGGLRDELLRFKPRKRPSTMFRHLSDDELWAKLIELFNLEEAVASKPWWQSLQQRLAR